MGKMRLGIIGLGVQGSLYAGILSGRLGPMTLPLPKNVELTFSKGKLILEDGARLRIIRFAQDESRWNRELTFKDMTGLKRGAPEKLTSEESFSQDVPFYAPYARVFENFAAHVLEGEPLIASGADGLREVAFANSIYLSAWTGQEVTFPGDGETFSRLLQERIDRES